jgi:hypothetical protein
MVVLREKGSFGYLIALMRGQAFLAEQNFYRIFDADSVAAERNQIVTQGMFAEIKDWPQRLVAAHFTTGYLVHIEA